MPLRRDIEAYRQSQQELAGQARREVAAFYGGLDHGDSNAVRDALLFAMPEIIRAYGAAAGERAADFYSHFRDRAGLRDNFDIPVAASAPVEQISASTRWAVGGLYLPEEDRNPAAVLSNLEDVTDRLTKQTGRDTLTAAIIGDPMQPRYARVPTGTTTCKFCAMLASRGAVYLTKESAGAYNRFHANCDCQPVPVFEGEELPYDRDYYWRVYQEHGGAAIDLARRYDSEGRFVFTERVLTAEAAAKTSLTRPPITKLPEDDPFARLPQHQPAGSLIDEADEVNPFYGDDRAYGINCQMCTTATELRARGFDVEAVANDGNAPTFGFGDIPSKWLDENGQPSWWDAMPRNKAQMDIVVESWPEGARGAVGVVWRNNRGAHIFNVEKRNGKAVYVDAQPATRGPSARAPDSWYQAVSWGRRKGPGAFIIRLDNKTPVKELTKHVRPRGSLAPSVRGARIAQRDAQRVERRVWYLRDRKRYIRRKRDEETERVADSAKREAIVKKWNKELTDVSTELARLEAQLLS